MPPSPVGTCWASEGQRNPATTVAIAVVLPAWYAAPLGRLKLIDEYSGVCSMNGSNMANGEYEYGVVPVVAVDEDAAADRERPVGAVVVVQRQAQLLQVVDALGAPGRLARRLHGGE